MQPIKSESPREEILWGFLLSNSDVGSLGFGLSMRDLFYLT
jgi:hypothetical protein